MAENDTVVFPEPGEITIEQRAVPEPDSDELLVESSRSLISTGTELTLLNGDVPAGSVWDQISNFPVVGPGYCTVGTIVEVGSDIDEDSLGKRVAIWKPHQRFNVVDAESYFEIPDSIGDAEATFFGIAQIVMNGLRIGRISWGETVCVYGLGLLGQLSVRLAHVAGARPVVGLDIADERLSFLPDSIIGLNPAAKDPPTEIAEISGGDLADVVVEVTGNPAVIPDEFEILRDLGRLVVLSSPDGTTEIDFHDHCNRGSYEILGAHVYSHPDTPTPRDPWTRERHAELFFEYIDDGSLDATSLITHSESYRNAPDLYSMLNDRREEALGVIIEW